VRGVSCALALLLSARANDSFGGFPPTNGWMWIVIAVCAVALVGAAAGERSASRNGRAIVCALAGCIAALLMPVPMWQSVDARLLLAGALGVIALLLLPVGMHRGGFSFWCACSMAIAGTSVVALLTGFAKLAVALGAVSCACGWIGVASALVRPRHALHAGISGTLVLVAVTVLGAASAFGYETSSTPAWIFVAAGASPLGCWLGEAPPFRASRMASALARILGVVVIAGAAVTGAVLHANRNASTDADAYACVDDARTHASSTNASSLW
jgi:lysylphosphatidylglycerol synthetase-like protein (DUF2156 family)